MRQNRQQFVLLHLAQRSFGQRSHDVHLARVFEACQLQVRLVTDRKVPLATPPNRVLRDPRQIMTF